MIATPRLGRAVVADEIGVVLSHEQALVLAKVLTDYRSRVVPLNRAQLVAAGVREDLVDQVACVGGWEPEPWTDLALEIFELLTPIAPPNESRLEPRRTCPVCGDRVCVMDDGRLRRHGPHYQPGRADGCKPAGKCPGSGGVPVERDDLDDLSEPPC